MPDYAVVTLGAFAFTGDNGASIVGEIRIGAKPRTIVVASNALAAAPVQVNAFTSGYRPITLPVKLAGIESTGETAPNHLQRMYTNLTTEVEKDANTLVIQPWGMDSAYTYTVHMNEDFERAITLLTQSRAVMRFDLTLNCLP